MTLKGKLENEAVEAGQWTPQEVRAADLPARFGYVTSPAQLARAAP